MNRAIAFALLVALAACQRNRTGWAQLAPGVVVDSTMACLARSGRFDVHRKGDLPDVTFYTRCVEAPKEEQR